MNPSQEGLKIEAKSSAVEGLLRVRSIRDVKVAVSPNQRWTNNLRPLKAESGIHTGMTLIAVAFPFSH